jgi:ABC-type sugar transport system substrate-binding protein
MSASGVSTARVGGSGAALTAYLKAHANVDALYAVDGGPAGTGAARAAVAGANRTGKITLVGSDYDAADLQAIAKGTELATTTQQQYLQGYLAAVVTRVYFTRGQVPAYISTGPRLITKSNITSVLAGLAKGLR